ncbi:MAG: 30S ribosomal protein S5 [Parcubacteria group bacterium]|nr:30S ribosomal protein S5 [Parcubacteria group bacterium]MBI2048939.1 30S ribosomal protein S5 [Parcubacteria group bacterium]
MDTTKTKENKKPFTKNRSAQGKNGARHGGGASRGRGNAGGAFGGDGKGGHRSRRPARSRSGAEGKNEFAQKVIGVRRVARVVQGGRRFSFSTTVVIGDRNGRVGLGTGKASDTALAIEKAIRDAKKHIVKVPRTKNKSLFHEVRGKHCSSRIFIIPAKGRGLSAGSSVRSVLDLAGVKDVTAKIFSRSKNKLNNARATMVALEGLEK